MLTLAAFGSKWRYVSTARLSPTSDDGFGNGNSGTFFTLAEGGGFAIWRVVATFLQK